MIKIKAKKMNNGSVELYDFNTGEFQARYPKHYSNKPDYRSKYTMFNCFRYILVWIK